MTTGSAFESYNQNHGVTHHHSMFVVKMMEVELWVCWERFTYR